MTSIDVPRLAVILAAGQFNRLQDSGIHIPKPLLRIGHRSLLHGVVRRLPLLKIKEVLIATRNTIVEEVSAEARYLSSHYGALLQIRVVAMQTDSSADSLRHILTMLDKPESLYVVACDVIWELEYTKKFSNIAERHSIGGLSASVAVTRGVPVWSRVSPTPLRSYVDMVGEPPALVRHVRKQQDILHSWKMEGPLLLSEGAVSFALENEGQSGITMLVEQIILAGGSVLGIDIGPALDIDTASDLDCAIANHLVP